MRTPLLVAICVFAGMVAGYLLAGGSPATHSTAAPPVTHGGASPATTAGDASRSFTIDDIRAVVREELAQLRSAGDPVVGIPGAGSQAARPDPAPTSAQVAAAGRAQAVIDAALARRTWTVSDAEALREEFGALSDEQRESLLRQWTTAVNQGRLDIQAHPSPI